jgi:hypothetical protein
MPAPFRRIRARPSAPTVVERGSVRVGSQGRVRATRNPIGETAVITG